MSGWLGFTTAVSGLMASQKSLYITNHNITNANTEGYSRQKGTQSAASAMNLPGIGLLGTGTVINEITRIRDSYIDTKYWNEQAPSGEWDVKRKSLVELEKTFNEPSDSGFRKNLDEFFTALESLSSNPSSYANRSLVREKAVTLTEHLNETAKKLYNVQKELNFQVRTKVSQVNDYANQIKNLNGQIFKNEIDGSKANDLRDKRELIVDKLSKIVDIKASENQGQFRVEIGGVPLVDHVNAKEIKLVNDPNVNPLNPKVNLTQVKWDVTDAPVKLTGGELKGLIDARDGSGTSSEYRGTPYYIKQLDKYAQKMVEKMNGVHSSGSGLNGSTGKYLFTVNDKTTVDWISSGETVRADNISVSGDILGDLDNIAAASGNNGVENNENVLKLIGLREDNNFFDTDPQGTPDDFVKSILSNLSVDSQQAKRMNDNQTAITKNILIRRESESGVSIDEEMSNMVKFQHSYNAAARIITTIDAIYDVTINRLGLVGR